MLNTRELQWIGEAANATGRQVSAVIDLLQEGATVPFISRYRKERTGGLDEVAVQRIEECWATVRELRDRKTTVLKTIEEQGKLTDGLRQRIEETMSRQELEDLYLPYRPKRRTRATIARERGLEPLAAGISDGLEGPLESMAAAYVDPEKDVLDTAAALAGASDILAEGYAETVDIRAQVRRRVWEQGHLVVSVTDEWRDQRSKFEQYYDYRELLRSMPSHRILAIRRGEKEKVLRTAIESDRDGLISELAAIAIPTGHPHGDFLRSALADAVKRLILPSVELDIRSEMKKQADEEAIGVFAANLEGLLLAPPAGNRRVLGVDPGYRTGCKMVALDETGKLLAHTTIYPTKPREATAEATAVVREWLDAYGPEAVAIGNGTASRETEAFFRGVVGDRIPVSVISEAGASVYSASDAAREEFPDHDVTVRGAVSIGRRFQDPLAELVKIEPKAIGVGQYQHDVNQALLKRRLDTTVISVVNRVGVDVNTASWHLLRYVSGIGDTLARNIVAYRNEHGRFESRESLKQVKLFGEKAFQQSAGFLRIRNGASPLDNTGIHPETYFLVEQLASAAGGTVSDLLASPDRLDDIRLKDFVTDTFGLPTLQDVVKELKAPGRDPRSSFEVFSFTPGVETLSDLHEGMVLNGVVTNVTDFGAFVDIGVHQDGLVHISQLSHTFVRHPSDVVTVGQKVQVKVLEVDLQLQRISLSMKALEEKTARGGRKRERGNTPRRSGGNPLDKLKRKWGAQ